MTAIRRLAALATTAIITAAATVPSPLQAQESKRKPTKMKTIDPAENPKVEHRIREFLKALNSGGGRPLKPFGREDRDSSGRLLDQRFISIWDTPPALPNRRHRRGAFLPQAASA
jgi:hypothetical protein